MGNVPCMDELKEDEDEMWRGIVVITNCKLVSDAQAQERETQSNWPQLPKKEMLRGQMQSQLAFVEEMWSTTD